MKRMKFDTCNNMRELSMEGFSVKSNREVGQKRDGRIKRPFGNEPVSTLGSKCQLNQM